jgi:hypothetical protein
LVLFIVTLNFTGTQHKKLLKSIKAQLSAEC